MRVPAAYGGPQVLCQNSPRSQRGPGNTADSSACAAKSTRALIRATVKKCKPAEIKHWAHFLTLEG